VVEQIHGPQCGPFLIEKSNNYCKSGGLFFQASKRAAFNSRLQHWLVRLPPGALTRWPYQHSASFIMPSFFA